jgi:hypothetical protein
LVQEDKPFVIKETPSLIPSSLMGEGKGGGEYNIFKEKLLYLPPLTPLPQEEKRILLEDFHKWRGIEVEVI